MYVIAESLILHMHRHRLSASWSYGIFGPNGCNFYIANLTCTW